MNKLKKKSLDYPPEDYIPGSLRHARWWNDKLLDPDWERSVRVNLELLTMPDFYKQIQKSRSEEEGSRTSLEQLLYELENE